MELMSCDPVEMERNNRSSAEIVDLLESDSPMTAMHSPVKDQNGSSTEMN